jgi:hypothetical protein
VVDIEHPNFNDWSEPCLLGASHAGSCVARLDSTRRARLRGSAKKGCRENRDFVIHQRTRIWITQRAQGRSLLERAERLGQFIGSIRRPDPLELCRERGSHGAFAQRVDRGAVRYKGLEIGRVTRILRGPSRTAGLQRGRIAPTRRTSASAYRPERRLIFRISQSLFHFALDRSCAATSPATRTPISNASA